MYIVIYAIKIENRFMTNILLETCVCVYCHVLCVRALKILERAGVGV